MGGRHGQPANPSVQDSGAFDAGHYRRGSASGAGGRCRGGLVNVFVQHTSCSLTVTENADASVRHDLETLARRWAPDGDAAYRHDDEGEDDMAAHARSVLTGCSVSIPVSAGELLLGTWQGIYLWEHRTTPHVRRVVVTIIG